MPNIIDFKPFDVQGADGDIKQIYATVSAHKWIKETAEDKKVRMTAVIDALIDHAEHSEETFKHLLEVITEMDNLLIQNGATFPTALTEKLDAISDKYYTRA